MTTIDTALGGQTMVGRKTLAAGFSFIVLMLLNYVAGYDVDSDGKKVGMLMDADTRDLLLSIIATYGGLGALSKFERGKKEK